MAEREENVSGSKAPKARIDAAPSTSPEPTIEHGYSASGQQEVHEEDKTQTASKAGSSSTDGAAKKHASSVVRDLRAWLEDTFPGNVNAVIFAVLGLIVALLLFMIGLWRTLVLVVLVVLGVAFGQYLDGDPKIVRFFTTLFSDRNHR